MHQPSSPSRPHHPPLTRRQQHAAQFASRLPRMPHRPQPERNQPPMDITPTPPQETDGAGNPIQRDKNGRYRLPNPATGKTRSWQRATRTIDNISDKTMLQRWKQRTLARAVATDPGALTEITRQRDDRELDSSYTPSSTPTAQHETEEPKSMPSSNATTSPVNYKASPTKTAP